MSSLEKLGEGDANDFSCYITIRNTSDYDLGLIDYGINAGYGEWPREQPLNTIEARTTERIHLKDRLGTGGSDGWVQFEVHMEHGTETFRLDFADPTGLFSKNSLRASSSNPTILSVSVTSFNERKHPVYGYVDVRVNRLNAVEAPPPVDGTCDMDDIVEKSPESDDTLRAKFEIGFDAPGGPFFDKSPVHESIVIAAFIQSQVYVPRGTGYHNLNAKQWEYVRGLVWNDDPSCLLFVDRSDSNHRYSDGIDWAREYKQGEADCMTQRSHFGNLQFLHAMGCEDGEKPEVTKAKLIKWLEVMYKLACGEISEQDQLKQHFGKGFTDKTVPSGDNTLRQLLLAKTPNYPGTDVRRRALGTCLHIISDSYAVGHTQRRLRNGGDYAGRDGRGRYRFKPGTYGSWGPIVAFHTYNGQDGDGHSHYDGLARGQAPPVPKDLSSFDPIMGARDAVAACTRLIDCWAQKRGWGGGVRRFLETDVFALDANAQPSNSAVDESEPLVASAIAATGFGAGMRRKLASLEDGNANVCPGTIADGRSIRRVMTMRSGLLALLTFLAAILLMLISVQFHA
ncbi:hypothetical protein F4809DRAFT_664250 [Biscogniauxia mediterranea]|nr:hypothetical protein F4809DRAFT_664250 [Biscogniauxia mediterranea]